MASNSDFVQYIVDQCSGAGVIDVKKMMGDYCAYCNGVHQSHDSGASEAEGKEESDEVGICPRCARPHPGRLRRGGSKAANGMCHCVTSVLLFAAVLMVFPGFRSLRSRYPSPPAAGMP